MCAELRRAGCVAAEEEAGLILGAAAGDPSRVLELVRRRATGEPLAWLTGRMEFCGEPILVHPGVFVPRWQTEALTARAAAVLAADGIAVDLCTGSGAVAVVLGRRRPGARVVGSDIDPRAVACARSNGVEAYLGDMSDPLPAEIFGQCDVVTAVVPYVPTRELPFLPRDVTAFEPLQALDGGDDGTRFLVQAVSAAAALLRPGGSLFLELGGREADLLRPRLHGSSFRPPQLLFDEDGDLRGLICERGDG